MSYDEEDNKYYGGENDELPEVNDDEFSDEDLDLDDDSLNEKEDFDYGEEDPEDRYH